MPAICGVAMDVPEVCSYAPWVDVTMTNPASTDVQGRDRILRVPGLQWAGRAWAGDLDPGDPLEFQTSILQSLYFARELI